MRTQLPLCLMPHQLLTPPVAVRPARRRALMPCCTSVSLVVTPFPHTLRIVTASPQAASRGAREWRRLMAVAETVQRSDLHAEKSRAFVAKESFYSSSSRLHFRWLPLSRCTVNTAAVSAETSDRGAEQVGKASDRDARTLTPLPMLAEMDPVFVQPRPALRFDAGPSAERPATSPPRRRPPSVDAGELDHSLKNQVGMLTAHCFVRPQTTRTPPRTTAQTSASAGVRCPTHPPLPRQERAPLPSTPTLHFESSRRSSAASPARLRAFGVSSAPSRWTIAPTPPTLRQWARSQFLLRLNCTSFRIW